MTETPTPQLLEFTGDEEYQLNLQICLEVFHWKWTQGPAYDVDGPCDYHMLPVPPEHDPKTHYYPPRGIITPSMMVRQYASNPWHLPEIMRTIKSRGLGQAFFDELKRITGSDFGALDSTQRQKAEALLAVVRAHKQYQQDNPPPSLQKPKRSTRARKQVQ